MNIILRNFEYDFESFEHPNDMTDKECCHSYFLGTLTIACRSLILSGPKNREAYIAKRIPKG